jgi:hypothetical protein
MDSLRTSTLARGIVVLAIGMVAAGALAITPAIGGERLATRAWVKNYVGQLGEFRTVLQGGDWTASPPNDDGCTDAATWKECADVTVSVPAGKTYKIAIDGTGSFFAFGEANRVQLCTSVRPSSATFNQATHCANAPTGITIEDGQAESASVNGIRTLQGGASGRSYVVSTAVRPDADLDFFNGFDVTTIHTMVSVFEAPS